MKIKDTLNLGKTEFPMRAGLPKKEPEWQAHWEAENLYVLRQKLNAGKPSYMLHDGPPYANGNIHIGHSLNKISKDIIVRYKSMAGFRAPYVPGWDTHGLPIEQQLAKAGVKRKEMDRGAYLALCRKYALEQIDMQRKDFKSLGVLGDWENPYMTLAPEFEAQEIRVFGKMAEKGYIYRGAKPIYWSWSSESSLAEAEIEYQDVESPSLYIAFKVRDTKGVVPADAEFVIWTTTAWTLPSNRGIFVHPDYEYVLAAVADRKFIVAKALLEQLTEKLGWQKPEILATYKGAELENLTATHPFYDRESLVMTGEYVTLDSGTGLVHTSPNHGEDDYFYSRKYKLPVIEDLDEQGRFTSVAEGFEGDFYDDVEEKVLEKLHATNRLLFMERFTHSYPHDWRTKKPVVYRATPQWFASIDPFREQLLKETENVEWIVPWGKTRLYNMIRDRGDWVISRQRAWGVPLPIFYGEDGSAIITPETTEHVAQLFEKHGSGYWFTHEAAELLPEGFTHPSSPNGVFTKETDIMDVWFDSGSSWNGVLNTREDLSYPADLYLEGSDQYRGWFNSSITTSVAVNGIAPYKAVLSQGFVLDGEGKKMSKSLGNTIGPKDVTSKYGADILRLWVASVDYENDVRVSLDILQQTSEAYRKIRNTLRFLIANTSDFDPAADSVAFEHLQSSDKFEYVKLDALVGYIRAAYDNYSFMSVYKLVVNYLSELSAFYLNFAKDVVYIEAADSRARHGMQTVMYKILSALTKLLVPILPHTAEEVWAYLQHEDAAFAYLSEMPEPENISDTAALMDTWSAFMEFRDNALKALEDAREAKVIGRSMEAKLVVHADEPTRAMLVALDENVAKLLIVSSFEVLPFGEDGVAFDVVPADGTVCERCRRIDPTVGANANFPELCENCAHTVATEFPELTAFEK
ncbi:MAG: isoleucine--tRNA ligase [Streptococcaceae bacterium]|jgi:isoleucyl-tRNA synthetase|nr:isoleucine--tRNA ligase [Streptococcaceae bacterium]